MRRFVIWAFYVFRIWTHFSHPDWVLEAEGDEDDDVNVWEDNWDDDNVEDDFNQQLRAHIEKQKMETWIS